MPKIKNLISKQLRTISFLATDESINKIDAIRKLTGFVSISEIMRFCISYTYESLKKEAKQ
jgi:hypothetical protein